METRTIINIFFFVITVHNPTCVLAGLYVPLWEYALLLD